MKRNITEIIMILDRSGSMSGLEKDTIGGYNSFLKKQRKFKGETLVTTVLFDDRYEILHNGEDIDDIYLTEDDYFTRGSTALLDAIGKTITDVSKRHKNLKAKYVPDQTIFVITTDGYENASKEFTYKAIKRLIEKKKGQGWEFMFIGADIDEQEEARKLSIDKKNTRSFKRSEEGLEMMYEDLTVSVAAMRKK